MNFKVSVVVRVVAPCAVLPLCLAGRGETRGDGTVALPAALMKQIRTILIKFTTAAASAAACQLKTFVCFAAF